MNNHFDSLLYSVHTYTKWERAHEKQVYKHFEKYLKGESHKKIPGLSYAHVKTKIIQKKIPDSDN